MMTGSSGERERQDEERQGAECVSQQEHGEQHVQVRAPWACCRIWRFGPSCSIARSATRGQPRASPGQALARTGGQLDGAERGRNPRQWYLWLGVESETGAAELGSPIDATQSQAHCNIRPKLSLATDDIAWHIFTEPED